MSTFSYIIDSKNTQSDEWVRIKNVIEPANIFLRWDKELDSGNFSYIRYTNSSTADISVLKMFRIRINGQAYYFVGKDDSALVTKNNGVSVWQHSVQLTEPTKSLQGVFIDGFSVSQPEALSNRKNLYEVTTRLLRTSPLHVTGQRYTLTTDSKVVGVLKGALSPEFKWNSQTSLWECLLEIGGCINCIPRLAIRNSRYCAVTFDFTNEQTDTISTNLIADDTLSYGESISEEQYSNRLTALVENVIED